MDFFQLVHWWVLGHMGPTRVAITFNFECKEGLEVVKKYCHFGETIFILTYSLSPNI